MSCVIRRAWSSLFVDAVSRSPNATIVAQVHKWFRRGRQRGNRMLSWRNLRRSRTSVDRVRGVPQHAPSGKRTAVEIGCPDIQNRVLVRAVWSRWLSSERKIIVCRRYDGTAIADLQRGRWQLLAEDDRTGAAIGARQATYILPQSLITIVL